MPEGWTAKQHHQDTEGSSSVRMQQLARHYIVLGKIPAKLNRKHLSLAVDLQLRENRQRSEKKRSCTDHIFTPRNIIERCTECQRSRYVNFVDFTRAFNTVSWHNGHYEPTESPFILLRSSEVSLPMLPLRW